MAKCEETVAQGWKPGAVSKCLLRMLNRAKRRTSTVQNNILLKKSKTKDAVKPVLIISKKQGQYNVEMQASAGPSDYKPLIYKIASASNEEKVKKRERKERRLMKKVFEEFRDPYHPQLCEQTCYCAYKDAVGFFEDVPEVNKEVEPSTESSSSCDEGSDCSSLDVDWEIHFTPPIARHSVLKSGKALNVA